MVGLWFWELDNVWSIYWKDNWIFIYLLLFLSTWKKLKGLHCGQVPASYFDTCRKSEVRKWCIFIIIHWNIHGLVNIIFSPISTCSPCQKSLFQFVRSLSKIKPVHNGGSTGLQEIINNEKNNRYQHQGVEQNLAFEHEVLDFSEFFLIKRETPTINNNVFKKRPTGNHQQ